MDRTITRRDLLHGMAAGAMIPGQAFADGATGANDTKLDALYYPPELTGLRGEDYIPLAEPSMPTADAVAMQRLYSVPFFQRRTAARAPRRTDAKDDLKH